MGKEAVRDYVWVRNLEAAGFDYATYQPEPEDKSSQTPSELIKAIRYRYRSTIPSEVVDVLKALRTWYATKATNEMIEEHADGDKRLILKKEEETATTSLNKTLVKLLRSRNPGYVSTTIRNVRRLEQAFASQSPEERRFQSPVSATADAITNILAIPLNPPAGVINPTPEEIRRAVRRAVGGR